MTEAPIKMGLVPMHPGEFLREDILPALGKDKTEIAALLGVSRQYLYDILGERKPISPSMALRLGKLFGNGPDLWLDLQSQRDLWQAQQKTDVSNIPTLTAA